MKNILMVFAHLLTHSPTYSLTHSLTHSEPGPTGTSPVSRDWGFARYLTKEIGVTPIPPRYSLTHSLTYLLTHLLTHQVHFTVMKQNIMQVI